MMLIVVPEVPKGGRAMARGATALTDSETLDKLSDLIVLKLGERQGGNCLLSSGSWVRIPPGTLLHFGSKFWAKPHEAVGLYA